jgi:hypothetical protein
VRFETELDAEERGMEEYRWYHARAAMGVLKLAELA